MQAAAPASLHALPETPNGYGRLAGVLLMTFAEFGRAVAAARRYDELKRTHRTALQRADASRADVSR
jgi:hypothetical protein